MKRRLIFMIGLLIIRIALGWSGTVHFANGKKIRLDGEVIKVKQNHSDCIIKISRFWFLTEKICAANRGDKISVVGTLDKKVIDVLRGEIWLRDAEIDIPDIKKKIENKKDKQGTVLANFRIFFVERLKSFVPEPEAGLIAGIVFGYKKDIRQKFYQEMINSGTVHIAVASGYNILLVGGSILSFALNFIKRKQATIIAIAGMVLYAAVAGAEPPVMRALWMAAILYAGKALGRGRAALWPFVLAVWVMLMIDPPIITSVSFQLSVAASVGLLVFEPRLKKIFEKYMDGTIAEILSGSGMTTTFATMTTTMPFLWWHFGRMSLIGIVSNILILPLVPLLMVLGIGTVILPQIFWVPAYVVAHWMVRVIGFFGN